MFLQSVPNPDYMNGTMAAADPDSARRFAMNSDFGGSTGRRFALNSDLAMHGMGTTGSLGVNFAAPLTRGGFPGEIFDSQPMPTGNWKDAPTPVMLGTTEPMSTTSKILTAAVLLVGAYFIYRSNGPKKVAKRRLSARSRRLFKQKSVA
jgi:hypothetical protein